MIQASVRRAGWMMALSVISLGWLEGIPPAATTPARPERDPVGKAPSPPQPAPNGTLLAMKGDSGVLRVSRDPAVLDRLGAARQRAAVNAPRKKPDWRLTLYQDRRHHELVYWHGAGVLGERAEGEEYRCWRAPQLRALLEALPKAMDTSAVKSPREVGSIVHSMPRLSGSFPSLGGLCSISANVFVGRIVGVSECYYLFDGTSRRQWTSYVVQIRELLKTSWRLPLTFVRLKWPGGYLNGGETWRYPLLDVGGDYIFFSGGPAWRRIEDGRGRLLWYEDHGEEFITREEWGWIGFGLLRIKNGRVAPAFPHVEAELQQRLAQGGQVPLMNEISPHPIPAWGLPVGEYLWHLRRAARSASGLR